MKWEESMVPGLGVQVSLQGCAGAVSSRLMRAVRAHLSQALLSDVRVVAGNQPRGVFTPWKLVNLTKKVLPFPLCPFPK